MLEKDMSATLIAEIETPMILPQVGAAVCRMPLKPPLKWAGGKRWLVPRLGGIWAKHAQRRLVEPMCGGLAVALGLMPEQTLLNDINPHAVNFYAWLKQGLRTRMAMQNESEFYYECRERFNRLIRAGGASDREAAILFYYLNRTGYNGLCRFNRQGEFNVPFGKYKTINYRKDFSEYKESLSSWNFVVGDFEDLSVRSSDFIYADPPYDVEFTQYSKEGFGWGDQERLAAWLAGHAGPVVASNQATDRIVKLYKGLGFAVEIVDAPRMINCTGDRTRAREILATKGI